MEGTSFMRCERKQVEEFAERPNKDRMLVVTERAIGIMDTEGSSDEQRRMIARLIPKGPLSGEPINKRGLFPPPLPTLPGPDAELDANQHSTRSTSRIKWVAVPGN